MNLISTVRTGVPVTINGNWRVSGQSLSQQLSNPWLHSLIEFQDIFHFSTTEFFRSRGLKAAYLPITTHSVSSPSASGSDSSPVRIDLFGVPTYLSDSMQFMLEYGCRISPKGVYYVLPSFRGELPDSRHLSQFMHAEAEIQGDLKAVMELVEAYIRFLCFKFSESLPSQWAYAIEQAQSLSQGPVFASIEHDEALEQVVSIPGAIDTCCGNRVITAFGEAQLLRNHSEGPLWVVRPPASSVPFYQARCPHRHTHAKCADLLLGIGETVGAGERHFDRASTAAALREQGVSEDDYGWYLEMKEAKPLQTAGFGLGVERFFLWLTGHRDIRDMQLVHRANGERWLP